MITSSASTYARPRSTRRWASSSGGNQQKVVLARWLAAKPKVLILDEPTRGIDVGAKSEIYRLIDSLANEGLAIMLISSELPEVLGMSDRIYVMQGGRITGELSGPGATEGQVLELAMARAPQGQPGGCGGDGRRGEGMSQTDTSPAAPQRRRRAAGG